jgi:hypothetical protein
MIPTSNSTSHLSFNPIHQIQKNKLFDSSIVPKNSLRILSYNGLWSLATSALFSGPKRIYGAPQLSGAIGGVLDVAAKLLQCHAKFQLESLLEARGDAITV